MTSRTTPFPARPCSAFRTEQEHFLYLPQIRLDREIRTALVHADILEPGRFEICGECERHGARSRDLRRVEENELMDDAGSQGSAVECGTCLQQNIQNIAPAKLRKNSLQVDPLIFRFHPDDFDAGILQF